jgi:hypothetical protein
MIKSVVLVIVVFIGLVLIILIALNILRKWYWDAIQLNLLDLVDDIGGQVIRRGFFSRPIYHGSYLHIDLTINFSSEKLKKGRSNLIDISLATSLTNSFTIASFQWLQELEEKSIADYTPLYINGQPLYGIRITDLRPWKVKLDESNFINRVEKLHPFRFIFVGQQGILFEKETKNLPQNTRHPQLKEHLDGILDLISGFEK